MDCVRSVLNQTLLPSEVIVVNDGSTDRSSEILSSIKSPLVKVFNQKNLGPSVSRNVGLKMSKESLVAFLDADDKWHPKFLERIYDMTQRHPEASIFGSSYYNTNQKRYWKAKHSMGITEKKSWLIDNFFEVNIKDFIPNMSSFCVKKTDFISDLFSPSVEYHEDVDFFLKHLDSHKIAITSEALSYIGLSDHKRRSMTSISGKKTPNYDHYLMKFKHVPYAIEFIYLQLYKYYILAVLTRDLESIRTLKMKIDFSKISFLKRAISSLPLPFVFFVYKIIMCCKKLGGNIKSQRL